jgi:hypothetical protein
MSSSPKRRRKAIVNIVSPELLTSTNGTTTTTTKTTCRKYIMQSREKLMLEVPFLKKTMTKETILLNRYKNMLISTIAIQF